MNWRACWFTSSCTAPTPSGGESRIIAGPELAATDRAWLLALARAALAAHLAGGRPERRRELPGGDVPRGAFVTLMARGDLRGCVGRVRTDRPLAELVCELVVAAARDDDRFAPITPEELPVVRIEISVLSEPALLRPAAAERIAIGRDGLLVRRGSASGLLLPQVAPEHGWGAEGFLAATCRKAGLAPDAWQDLATEVFTFQADVFGEDWEEGGGTGEG